MDNVTHTLVGLMLSRAGLNRLAPRASLILMLAANAPDMDVVTWFAGSVTHFCHHRGETHAWMFLPLIALAPVLVGWLFRPSAPPNSPGTQSLAPAGFASSSKDAPFRWGGAYLLSLTGVATHLLLDWTNSYAVRWSLPFSTEWHTSDLMFVIEPYVWLVFGLAVGAPWISRLVSSEIGAKRTSGRGWAIFALTFLLLYIGLRWQMRDRAMETLSARMYEGRIPNRVLAIPAFQSPMHWTGIVELDNSYRVIPINLLLDDFDPAGGQQFFKAESHPAIEIARKQAAFQCLEHFSKAPLWRTVPVAEPENSVRVQLFDLRFGTPVTPGFVASGLVTGTEINEVKFEYGSPNLRR